MKNVLLITVQYYPHNRPCSHRIHSFAKYLPQYGFRPTILCMKWDRATYLRAPGITNCYDPALEAVEVCRTERVPIDRPAHLTSAIRGSLRPLSWPPDLARRLPARAQELHAEEKFDVVLATSPYPMALAVASRFGRTNRVPWVADLRDVAGELKVPPSRNLPRTLWRHFVRRWAILRETRVCRSAAAVVTVSAPLAEILRERGIHNTHLVYNGFEPDEFAAIDEAPNSVFRIIYAGTVGTFRDPAPLFDALDVLIENRSIDPRTFEVCFYGQTPLALAPRIRGRGCQQVVKFQPRVGRGEFLVLVKNASLLLQVAHPNEKGLLTSKIFEYLGAARPVLSVPSDHDVIDSLLRETGAGQSGSSPQEIGRIIMGHYNQWKEQGRVAYHGQPEAIRRYTRNAQAARLANVLHQVTENHEPKAATA